MKEIIEQLLFFFSLAGCVGCVAWLVLHKVMRGEDRRISDRLSNNDANAANPLRGAQASGKSSGASLISRISTAASSPFMSQKSEQVSDLRKKLGMAGIYDPAVIRSFIGFKLILLFGGVIGGWVLGTMIGQPLIGLSFGGLLGYMAPKLWLKSKVSDNQKQLNIGLPDALDLMVICVESGLTIDASLQRVGDELAMAHPVISREFAIAHTETKLGVSRQQAFKNLSTRTGNANIGSLMAMLIQADKFGTGVGHALRVQAESMRIKRQFAAEEMAAKASVKMTFPLVLFLFPATFVVIGGPVAIELMNTQLN
jgi:tight adherence protein C